MDKKELNDFIKLLRAELNKTIDVEMDLMEEAVSIKSCELERFLNEYQKKYMNKKLEKGTCFKIQEQHLEKWVLFFSCELKASFSQELLTL